ncbi:hypothetical protein M758_2G230000 [Ceratodon purpureus]|nr:hypothetical protein M758_2G230000 [Ceratodon purpureus]
MRPGWRGEGVIHCEDLIMGISKALTYFSPPRDESTLFLLPIQAQKRPSTGSCKSLTGWLKSSTTGFVILRLGPGEIIQRREILDASKFGCFHGRMSFVPCGEVVIAFSARRAFGIIGKCVLCTALCELGGGWK